MPLGTLDRSPPPFFRQGPSALTKLVFFSALAIFLMVADARLRVAGPLRQALAIVLLPMQRALAVPMEMLEGGGDYLRGLNQAQQDERAARVQLAAVAERAARTEQLAQENSRLRALLELRPAFSVRSLPAEVLYEAADPYSRKVFIDRGRQQGVQLGSPVINEAGVLGQVTQAYALTSEVTLLSDKDAAIPVLNTRTQQRSAAFGGAGGMELRFMSGNADVQVGDLLHTSGLDGVYPPGLPVARVAAVERRVESGFARIKLTPAANPDGVRHVLVLEPLAAQLPARPAPAPEPTKAERGSKSSAKRAAPAAPASASAGASGASGASGSKP
jgi:rod shape-determining protein MreC